MTNQIVEIKPKAAIASLTPVNAARTVAAIAAMLPPKLPEDMPLKGWLKAMEQSIGEHPQAVLDDARAAILSTKPFAPSPAEIIDAILAAYKRLDLPLSEDAKRHLAYRKKTSSRYALNADGVQRFAPDAKVTTISYVGVSGVHANMLMDETADATIADIEAAFVSATALLSKREKLTISEILDEARKRLVVIMAHRLHGTPESYCGGAAAKLGERVLRTDYFAVSQAFVTRLRAMYPFACSKWGNLWDDAMADAFFRGAVTVKPDEYGRGSQASAENAVEAALAELNAQGRAERRSNLTITLREIKRAIDVLDRTNWDDPRPLRINAAGRSTLLGTEQEGVDMRRQLVDDQARVEREIFAVDADAARDAKP